MIKKFVQRKLPRIEKEKSVITTITTSYDNDGNQTFIKTVEREWNFHFNWGKKK